LLSQFRSVAADTPANQQAYPQNPAQAPGLGFPIVRLVVVFCLACGPALDAALGRYQGQEAGENALLRLLADAFEPGEWRRSSASTRPGN
jgi:hypothetical protein